jgi:prepilin-type processing-associated H-X9-DG protein
VFLCPDVPNEGNLTAATVSHYACHPRLMPSLDSFYGTRTDPYGNGPNGHRTSYNVTHIKRAAEIAEIFDSSLVPTPTGGWNCSSGVPIASVLDSFRILFGSFLTDATTTVKPGDRVDLSPNGVTNDFVHFNQDSSSNPNNIRFRHSRNTQANVLMADGHVESFSLSSPNNTSPTFDTDFRRSNVNVSP